jgi:hypothetical protein
MEYVAYSYEAVPHMNFVAWITFIAVMRLGLFFAPGPATDGPAVVQAKQAKSGGESRDHCKAVFDAVRIGLSTGDVNAFSKHLADQVQVNLRDGESGYFSAHQAFYLLENYFHTCRLSNLTFTTIGDSDTSPFATGGAAFAYKGGREYVQVYVSLSLAGDRWVISRLNIY